MKTVEGWEKNKLGNICSIEIGGTPSRNNPHYWDTDNSTSNYWVSIRDLNKRTITNTNERLSNLGVRNSNVKLQKKGTVLLSFKLSIGRTAFAGIDLFTNEAIAGLSTDSLDNCYLYYGLQHWDLLKDVDQAIKGTTLNKAKLKEIEIFYPESIQEQTKIADILSCIDTAIEQTEAMIAKQQRIKTGLMQDLLSKGIDEHGNIRTEQTHAFKDSELGRIPVEWEVVPFGNLIESAVDGPFGSNLKTEHYVTDNGVRVLRLQNIGNGEFIDSDKVSVSVEHANKLSRHSVVSGDLLVASLGDEKHPFGRSCLYPLNQPLAIVKADVFRIRCKVNKVSHSFVYQLLNLPRWRSGLFGLAQGVTRDRVNLSNLKLLLLPVPTLKEQVAIADRLDGLNNSLIDLKNSYNKLKSLKNALMQDLLSGNVRVNGLI